MCAFSFFLALCQPIFLRPVSPRHPFYALSPALFIHPPPFFYAQYHTNTLFMPLSLCTFYTFHTFFFYAQYHVDTLFMSYHLPFLYIPHPLFFTPSIAPTPFLCPITLPFLYPHVLRHANTLFMPCHSTLFIHSATSFLLLASRQHPFYALSPTLFIHPHFFYVLCHVDTPFMPYHVEFNLKDSL